MLGSAEAIEESLEKIGNAEVRVKIIAKGLGNIGEGDIARGEATKAQIVGFNVKLTTKAEDLAREKSVSVKTYRIIYDLINDIKAQMQELIEPEIERVELGKMVILAIFRDLGKEQIIGGRVSQGVIEADCFFEVERGGKVIGLGKLLELQAGKQIVKMVDTHQECGLKYQGEPVKEGDILFAYKENKIIKKL